MQLAHERLGYDHYPGPLGLKATPGAQFYHPCLGCCTECLVYRHLKEKTPVESFEGANSEGTKQDSIAQVEADPTDTGALCSNSEWSNPFCCFDDCYVCAMMSVLSCMTCGITGCIGRCKVGELIGTDEARELTSC